MTSQKQPGCMPQIACHPAGCRLPLEMLFPSTEYPSPEVVAALSEWGVASRSLPTSLGGELARKHGSKGHETVEATLSGFTLKVAAVILSKFREVRVAYLPFAPVHCSAEREQGADKVMRQVLFLDSDNVVADSPDFLFSTPEYKEHGAMLWPDYWESSAAPDVQAILGIDGLPQGTTESGQMLFDKARCDGAPSKC